MHHTPVFAFFDFDGTLTRTDTVLPFLRHYTGNDKTFFAKLLPLLPLLAAYLLGLVSNAVAKQALCRRYLRDVCETDVLAVAGRFAETVLPALLRPEGMERLHHHRERGDYCVLVSAAPDWYLSAWARQHGFDDLFATRMATQAHGRISGEIDGINCHGSNKVRLLEHAYGTDCWDGSYAYSDSRSDLPMLQRAEHAFLWRCGRFRPLCRTLHPRTFADRHPI